MNRKAGNSSPPRGQTTDFAPSVARGVVATRAGPQNQFRLDVEPRLNGFVDEFSRGFLDEFLSEFPIDLF